MGRYFPPSLQARGTAIRGGYGPSDYDTSGMTEIFFNMPRQNDVNALFGLDGSNGGHVQFTLKTKHNNTTVINPAYTPDFVTVYFNAKTNYASNGTPLVGQLAQIIHYGADLYSLYFSNILYQNPENPIEVGPIADTDYTIQMRFGDREISNATQWIPYPTEINGLQLNFTGFANWRANAVARQEFGEWSNTQTFYAYGPYVATLTADTNKWLPTFTFDYQTAFNDSIVNIEIRCQYILPSGEVKTEVENFSGDLGAPGRFRITRSVNIAPTDTLYVQVVPITEHNTIINDPLFITNTPQNPNNNGIQFGPYDNTTYPGGKIDNGDPTLPIDDIGRSPLLVSEERKDGIIAKRILSPVITGANGPYSLNVYRYDYYTREAVLIASEIDLTSGAAPYIFKDYCVEMGTQYQYAGVLQDKDGNEGLMLWEMFSPFVSGSDPFAELDKLEFPVLTSKNCQLRFQGNPSVSAFKREVQESFQTTIGSEYPFYSRMGRSNYRTLGFSGVVSINFDFTSLFLALDSTNHSYEKRGLHWENNLIVPIEKVYEQQQISLNRRRFNINNPFIAVSGEDNDIPGPMTIHDERLLASRKKKYSTQQTSDMIYLERRFREKAMSWLADGKPKLYRSETEGNMIVIASGVSFAPLQGSQRMVYTVTMTLTEIAEYNLTNLLKYNLVPSEIVANVEPVNTEFFGDHDPLYSDGILRFPDSETYDIRGVQNGRPIDPILIAYEQGLRVTGGAPQPAGNVPRYTFDIVEASDFETTYNLRWEQITRNGVECLRLYGIPYSNMPPRVFTARVTDSAGTVETIAFQFGGSSSAGSIFSIDAIPSMVYNGSPREPAVVVRENGFPLTIPPSDIVYSNNTNAGIATVTVTLPTGGIIQRSFNILQQTLTVSSGTVDISKVYDGSISSSGATLSGSPVLTPAVSGVIVVITPGQFTARGVGTSKAISVNLSLAGANAGNYALSETSALWTVGTITRKPITITPDSGQSRLFGVNDPAFTFTIVPALVAGDNTSGLLSRAPGATIGTYPINIGTLSAGPNYDVTFTTGVVFTIVRAPAPTLVWPQTIPIIYGQSLSDAMASTTNAFGTFDWDTPTIVPTVVSTGYSVTFTPNDIVNYDWSGTVLTRTVAVSVAPRQLVLNGVTGVDRIYDRSIAVTLTPGTLSGIIGSDVVGYATSPATMANWNVGQNKIVNFTAHLTGPDASNYTLIMGSNATVNIDRKVVTVISADGQDRPFNGFRNVNVEVVIGGIISGDNVQLNYVVVGEISSPMPGNAVPVTLSLSLLGTDRNNYSVPPITATVNILKAPQAAPLAPTLQSITTTTIVVLTDSAQEYSIDGGTTWQPTGIFTGLNPLTTYSVVGRFKETATAQPSPQSLPRTATTEPLTITFSITGFNGTFDGAGHGIVATLEPGATIRFSNDSGATYTLTTSPTFVNVGTYTVFYRISKPGAFDITQTEQITINALRITVTADNKLKALGQPDPPLTFSYSPPLIPGDVFTGALVRAPGEAAGNYLISRGTLALPPNYLMSFVSGTLNIGGVLVTITPHAGQKKVHGSPDPVLTYTFTPALQPGDVFVGALGRAIGEDVGTYPINIGSLAAPPSYALNLTPRTFEITPQSISVVADPQTKVFGTSTPALTFTTTPASAALMLTGSLSRAAGENVGTYTITQGTLNNPNFNIGFTPNNLTITPAPITRATESYDNTHEYTGSPITPTVSLVDSLTSQLLVENVDYTLSYLNNTGIGTASIIVMGIGNYQATITLHFSIVPIVTTLTIEAIGDIPYSGALITPLPVVKDGSTILTLNTHYTVTYSDNREVGTATVTANGIGPYLGNVATQQFEIIPASFTAAINNLGDLNRTFSPTDLPPTVTVDNNPSNGTVTAHYATSPTGPWTTTPPRDAGTYYVYAAIGATSTHLSAQTPIVSFSILPLATVFTSFSAASGMTIPYDGLPHEPGIPIVSGVSLVKSIDYELDINTPAMDAGVYSWSYSGKGNYTGSTGTFTLTITPISIAVQLTGAPPKIFGDPDPVFGYLTSPTTALTGLAGRAAGEDAGSYPLTLGSLWADNNHVLQIAPSSATHFVISPRSLPSYTAADWTPGDLGPTEFSHTGAPIEPVIVDWNHSVVPVVGTDIQYTYLNNISIGNAQAIVTVLSGNFIGTLVFNFQIQ